MDAAPDRLLERGGRVFLLKEGLGGGNDKSGTIIVRAFKEGSQKVWALGDITEKTVKILFGQNGNQCSFPGCKVPMVDETGSVLGQMCHINARSAPGSRFDGSVEPKMRQSEANLILLCANYHKSVDDNPSAYDVQILRDMKASHNAKAAEPNPETFEWFARLLLNQSKNETHVVNNSGNVAINSPGAVQAKTVNIKSGRRQVKIAPPNGCVGANSDMASYIEYLITRYNSFARIEPSRTKQFNYGVISKNITDRFGSKWALISEERFEELSIYLTNRIKRTRQAKSNASKGNGSFHSFAEHVRKLEG